MTISFRNIRPDDGNALQRATRRAERLMQPGEMPMSQAERDRLAAAVVWVARSGYARTLDGALDEEALSQAAAARLRSTDPANDRA